MYLVGIIIIIIIIIIFFFFFFFFHGLGRLTCSGIEALPSFPGASAIPSSPGFVGEGVFRESGVVLHLVFHVLRVVFPCSCQVFCHLIRRYPRLCVFAFEYFVFPWEGYQPIHKTPIFGGPVCLSVWPLSYSLSGLGGPTRNIKFPPA